MSPETTAKMNEINHCSQLRTVASATNNCGMDRAMLDRADLDTVRLRIKVFPIGDCNKMFPDGLEHQTYYYIVGGKTL